MRFRPTRNFFICLIAFFSFAVFVNVLPFLPVDENALLHSIFSSQNWLICGGIIFLLAGLDLWSIRKAAPIAIDRTTITALPVGCWHTVEITLHHNLRHATDILLCDNYPQQTLIEDMPQVVSLKPGMVSKVYYRINPTQRGNLTFGKFSVFRSTPLKLWQFKQIIGNPMDVKVFPNFAAISQYMLLALDNHTTQLGIRKKQRRGEGQDFHQLREYRFGDSLRQIDWKASSKRRKLISKEYQDERDQDIIFMLDCGRRMRSQDDDLSHFDHALNAMLLLSYIALKQGDAVGLMTFGGNETRWLAPKKGVHYVNSILNKVYDLQPTTRASDYIQATQDLKTYQRKRALVIFLSNIRDENLEDLLLALKILRRQHLLLLANLREQILDDVSNKTIEYFDDALLYSGVQLYLNQRHRIGEQLANENVLSLDVTPKQLPSYLVNCYLDIKRRGNL